MLELIYGLLFMIAVFSAFMVVIASHPVYNALYLVVTMTCIAGAFILINAELAAAFQLIVYAGAIMVLFIFVIMLLNLGRQKEPPARTKGIRIAGMIFAGAFVAQIAAMIVAMSSSQSLPVPADGFPAASAHEVGLRLVIDYLYAFEMTSVLLLIAVVGAIVLARRHLIQGAYDVTMEKPSQPALTEEKAQ